MEKHYQVVIVGGGPVGAALAVDLGLRGVSCAMVERRRSLGRIPKGQNLTQRTLEHFYFWGVLDEMRAAREMPEGYPIGEITAYGDLMSPYWYASAGREVVRPYYFQENDRLPQYRTEAVLRRKMDSLPGVDSYFGWIAKSVEQDEKGARVSMVEDGGEGAMLLTADYVVGCDGGNSMVRDTAGIERGGTDFDQLMVLAVFRSRALHKGLERFPERSTYRVMRPDLNGYWQFFGRIDVGEGWFFHAPIPREEASKDYDIKKLVEESAGMEIDCEVDHMGFWDLRVAVAEKYRNGRIFIAGDAAHTHPPYGGFGLNNGIEDAANLGWKLAAALKGWGGEALLDSYSDERRPVFQDTGENFIAARIKADGEFFHRYDPRKDKAEFEKAWAARSNEGGPRAQSYEPNYEGSQVVAGPPGGISGAHGEHMFKARAGHHLAPQPLSNGRNVFEELGDGYALLAFDAPDGSVEALRQAAEATQAPMKVIRDTKAGGREAYEARLVLVRPDQYVVWAGDEAPTDPRALIAKAVGR